VAILPTAAWLIAMSSTIGSRPRPLGTPIASGLLASSGRREPQASMLGMAFVVQMPINPARAARHA
jgi:hypothetical protein